MRACPQCRSVYRSADVEQCVFDGTALVSSDVDPLIGTTIDRYRVDALLGRGGVGSVYRVTHTGLDKPFALKVLFAELASAPMIVQRFQREAQTVSKMAHPNITPVHDFAEADGVTFLVMGYEPGRDLARIIHEEGPLDPERVLSFARQIALGLHHAHELGFVHRDIKPANVMIATEGAEEIVRILDFGLVASMTQKEDGRLTMQGTVLGTPAYMAPEQALEPSVEATADLYSTGVMMYEMLVGRLPFSASRPVELMMQHLQAPVPPMPFFNGLEKVVQQLMQKDPRDRPQSGAELTRLLDTCAVDSGYEIWGPTTNDFGALPASMQRPSATNEPRPYVVPASKVGIRPVVVMSATKPKAVPAVEAVPEPVPKPVAAAPEPISQAAPRDTPRRSWWLFAAVGIVAVAAIAVATVQTSMSTPQDVMEAEVAEPVLTVGSQPAGATVEVDGRVLGKTPLVVPAPAEADLDVRITKDGYHPWSGTLTPDEVGHFNVETHLEKTTNALE